MREQFSDQEAEEILRVASRSSHPGDEGMSRRRLMETAAELGITPEQVLAAEQEVLQKQEQEAFRAEYHAQNIVDFKGHLATYLAVNAVLVAIWLSQSHVVAWMSFWPIYTIAGWGLGVILHARATFNRESEEYQAGYEKWLEKKLRKQKRKQLSMQIQTKVESLISEILTVNPRGRSSAVSTLREQIGLHATEAKKAVDDFILKHRLR